LPEAVVGTTIRDVLREATGALRAAGCETPRLDAELLLAHSLGVGRPRLVLDADAQLDRCAVERFAALLTRRRRREPVAYILGRKGFRGIELMVDPRVLIPRPETELLVEAGLSLAAGARVADVGTGSGAVALALKDERPDLELWGIDVSADALSVARANGSAFGLEVHWVQADLLGGVATRFDAVLANLPYVADGSQLPPEIALYEPRSALFAGADGLDLIRRLIPQLGETPVVALEVGFDQAGSVADLLREVGWRRLAVLRDLAGHERVVVGRR
jgi:release factor glutamine methyltransferase